MNLDAELKKVLEHFRDELGTVRTGRANPGLVTELPVDSYGAMVPLKQVAQVSTPDAHTLLVAPWDPGLTDNIAQAIKQSDLGIQPVVDGNAVRLPIPPMTEERRTELTKVVGEKLEAARVAVRNLRHQAITAAEKEDLAEDALKHRRDQLTTVTQDYTKQLEDIAEAKRQELMSL